MDIFGGYRRYILDTYTRLPLVFVKGRGSILITEKGEKFIDLFPGWGASILGHSHPALVQAMCEQGKKLIHIPNNLYNVLQPQLAEIIIKNSLGKGKVFFCNSGTEATEAALKLMRAYKEGRGTIISMYNSFHGRTLGALTLTAQRKYQRGFGRLLPGIKYVRFDDFGDLEEKVDKSTCGIILEVIQGEGGVKVCSHEYLQKVRRLCDRRQIILVFDEVQTGMGRTGYMFAYQAYGVKPDIICLAKGLGGGFPIGALVVHEKLKGILQRGMHASTFGGSPLACAVSLKVFEIIDKENLLVRVRRLHNKIIERLTKMKEKYPVIKEIRGMGFMLGIVLADKGEKIVKEAIKQKLLINCTQECVLRIMPALNIEEEILNKGLDILEICFKKIYSRLR